MLKIYLSGPIIGTFFNEAKSWRTDVGEYLNKHGFGVLDPLRGTELLLDNKKIIDSAPISDPSLSDKAFVQRDKLDVLACDILLANFMEATKVSIGSLFELAWAEDHNKVVVVAMKKNDLLYNHPFIRETCIVFNTLNDAVDYILSCGV